MTVQHMKSDNDVNNTHPTHSPPVKGRMRRRVGYFLFILLLLGGGAAAAWYQYQENNQLHDMLTQQKKEITRISQIMTDDARIHSSLNGRLAEMEKQTQALLSIYQKMNNSEVQHLLADIEHTLTMASESLFVANDMSAALKLLQYADNKIRADSHSHPELVILRTALQKDIHTLSALPQIDMTTEMSRIDTLIQAIDTLPLNIEIQEKLALSQPALPENKDTPWWNVLAKNIWSEIKSLVRIRRLDKADQALLSVDQVMLLRENMKLRMVSARVALMTRNQGAYINDLQAVEKYLNRFFDQNQALTHQFTERLKNSLKVQVVNDKPIFTTLDVLRQLKTSPAVEEGR